MSERGKIRVGITQGDINGVGYEIIFKTFENTEMFDICTPIVFGSPKAAAYHRKALEMEIPYNAIEKAADAQAGKLNIINCNDDELHIELGSSSAEAGKAAFQALEKAVEAYRNGEIDKVFTTNLVYRMPGLKDRAWYSEVDMSKYISLLIDTLNHDETISELLNPVKRIHNLVDAHKKLQASQIKMSFDK